MLTTFVQKQLTFLCDADNLGVEATYLNVWMMLTCVEATDLFVWCWQLWCRSNWPFLHDADNFDAEATDLFAWCWQLWCRSHWPFFVMLTTLAQKPLTFLRDADNLGAEATDLFVWWWQLWFRSSWPLCVMLTTFVWKQLTFLCDADNLGAEVNDLRQFEMLCVVHNVLCHLCMVGVVICILWEWEVRKAVIVLGDIAENTQPSHKPFLCVHCL